MTRLRTAASALALATLIVGGCGVADTDTAESAATGEKRYIVKFVPGKGAAARAAAQGHGGDIVVDLDQHQAFAVYLPEAAAAALANNPAIDFVEIDPARQALSTQTTPYGITMVQADAVPAVPGGTPGPRKVCIIDSGFDGGHEDRQLEGVTGTNTPRPKRLGGGTIPWNQDKCGHGTHVAGTISAANNLLGVVGVTPFAPAAISLHIVPVFEGPDCRWTYASSLVAALDLCVKNGANVVNMSLGGGGASSTEKTAFDTALANGVLSIAAAGNEHDGNPDTNTAYSYPASYASVVSVAAIDAAKQVASFSNRNDQVDLAAPGVSVDSTVPMGMGREATLSTGHEVSGMEGSPLKSATGALVDCAFGATTCADAGGKICLISRGNLISFADKVLACQAGGGAGAIIYNNEPGMLDGGTMNGVTTTIPSVGMSDTDGATLKASLLGTTVTIALTATNYAPYNGTSMASPHVAGVAALVWSHNPSCTPQQVRTALETTTEDLGAAGVDNKFGHGLVQAADAVAALACEPAPGCISDTQCASGQVCDLATGSCEVAPSGPQACTAVDNRATGCGCTSNTQCYFGQCKGKPGRKTCN